MVEFDADYWRAHWRDAAGEGVPAHPAIALELDGLTPGRGLDAGCGEGAEAIELARRGWRMTAVDLSQEALDRGRLAAGATAVDWQRADLTTWQPARPFELVTTFYAHSTLPQIAFYERIAQWVAPGGTLLIVGHLAHGHGEHEHEHGHDEPGHDAPGHDAPGDTEPHPVAATTDVDRILAVLPSDRWRIETAAVRERRVAERMSGPTTLQDVVVRARRMTDS